MRSSLRLLSLAALAALGASSSPRPSVATRDAAADTVLFLTGGTGHRPDSKYDSTASPTVMSASVSSVEVTVRTADGQTYTRRFAGGEIDALFFTMPAVNKFVVPYYARRYGRAYGARVRHGALRAFGKSAP